MSTNIYYTRFEVGLLYILCSKSSSSYYTRLEVGLVSLLMVYYTSVV